VWWVSSGALAELEAWRCHGTTPALAASDGSLGARVRRVLKKGAGEEAQPRSLVVSLGLAFVLAVALGGIYASSLDVVFEFMAAEFGKPSIWQFLLEVRRNVVDGAGDIYQGAFNRTRGEFEATFSAYLRNRFTP
jgi:hypothetical protein